MDCYYQRVLSAVTSAGGGYLRNIVLEMFRTVEMAQQQQEREKDKGVSADKVEYLWKYHNNFVSSDGNEDEGTEKRSDWRVDDEREQLFVPKNGQERSLARKEAERVARLRDAFGARFPDLFGGGVDVVAEEASSSAADEDPAVVAFVRAVIDDHLREKQAMDGAIDMAFMSREVLETILADDRTSAESRAAAEYALRVTVPYVERRIDCLTNTNKSQEEEVVVTNNDSDSDSNSDEPSATATATAQRDHQIHRHLKAAIDRAVNDIDDWAWREILARGEEGGGNESKSGRLPLPLLSECATATQLLGARALALSADVSSRVVACRASKHAKRIVNHLMDGVERETDEGCFVVFHDGLADRLEQLCVASRVANIDIDAHILKATDKLTHLLQDCYMSVGTMPPMRVARIVRDLGRFCDGIRPEFAANLRNAWESLLGDAMSNDDLSIQFSGRLLLALLWEKKENGRADLWDKATGRARRMLSDYRSGILSDKYQRTPSKLDRYNRFRFNEFLHVRQRLHELQREAEDVDAGEWTRFVGMWDEALATYAATKEKKRKHTGDANDGRRFPPRRTRTVQ